MKRVLLAGTVLVLAGCGLARQAEEKREREARDARVAAAVSECAGQKFGSRVERIRCLNAAQAELAVGRNADLMELGFATKGTAAAAITGGVAGPIDAFNGAGIPAKRSDAGGCESRNSAAF